MGVNLTILQKGLILLAIPVCFQLVFFGALYKLELDDEETQHWAVHTKQVIAQTEIAYRRLLEAAAYVRRLVLTGEDPAASPPFHDFLRKAPADVPEVRGTGTGQFTSAGPRGGNRRPGGSLAGLLAQSEELIAAGRRQEALARMKDPVGAGITRLRAQRPGRFPRRGRAPGRPTHGCS